MSNLPSIQINKDIISPKKIKIPKMLKSASSLSSISNVFTPSNINTIKNLRIDKITSNNYYDYFNTVIPLEQIKKYTKNIEDDKFLFFLKYGLLRRYEGDCDIIYIEIPQIPRRLIVYRMNQSQENTLESFNLNNKDLPIIPLFENEDNLKYLSMESNHINKIEHLVSLNNLIYLNLYGNNIREIENLNNVRKLKTLILSRNSITQIKNVQMLTELETLDLHSNRIKLIENLQTLKNLREINLANNLLCSFHELILNKNLEDINLRKNLISVIPTLSFGTFDSLRKLNLSRNLINKIHYLEELTKLKKLKELYLEYNPVLNNAESVLYINTLPIKGKFPIVINSSNINEMGNLVINKKSSGNIDNSDNLSFSNIKSDNIKLIKKIKKKSEISFRTIKLRRSNNAFSSSRYKKYFQKDEEKSSLLLSSLMSTLNVRNFSPDFSKTKESIREKLNLKLNPRLSNANNTLYKTQNSKDNNKTHQLKINLNIVTKQKNLNDNMSIIQINIKILTIAKQWSKEYNYILINGYNGYNNVKPDETYLNLGYIEVDGNKNNSLSLYGNCLRILTKKELYNSINVIKFNYFNFDLITCKKYMAYFKMFKDLKKLYFNYNNIFSIYQLIKLESLDNLETIYIANNEICCSGQLVKLFIIYRMRNISVYNNEVIKYEDRILSSKIFEKFDNIILIKENQILEEKNKFIENEENKNERINKYNDNYFYDNTEKKIQMWNFAKKNLSTVLYNIFSEFEE